MPKIGEISIGVKWRKVVWAACLDCGKERWVKLVRGKPNSSRCPICAGRSLGKRFGGYKNHLWKGGKKDRGGYRLIKIHPDDFFYPMAQGDGYVFEHRLVVAKSLGRCLHRWEIVHHKNHGRSDNRIENLQLFSNDRHNQITYLSERIKLLESRVTLLEAENELWRVGLPEMARASLGRG